MILPLCLAAIAGSMFTVALFFLLRPLALEFRAVWTIYAIRKQQRVRALEESRRLASLKARVLAVGPIHVDAMGAIHLDDGWKFDNSAGAPEHFVDERGVYRYLGHTLAEIKEIHARRAEFSDAS